MKKADFWFDLPPELIAQHPAPNRSDSRLLELSPNGKCIDHPFTDTVDLLDQGDLLVLNNTKVINARFMGHKASGGRVEVMLERVISESRLLAQIKSSRAPKIDQWIEIDDAPGRLHVIGRIDRFFELEYEAADDGLPLGEWLDRFGEIPLPPYVERTASDADYERYQTVYAQHAGAVAAPTAGLHYSEALLAALERKGVRTAFVTLHVGAGTYLPVQTESVADHTMHSEWVQVDQAVCDAVNNIKRAGGRVIAVGTTSVRSLEAAALASSGTALQPFVGDTDIFIVPGFEFQVVDCLQTNFHLPESTLMMLVCAFSGYEAVMAAYKHAIQERYRFFSYGDAMFLTPGASA